MHKTATVITAASTRLAVATEACAIPNVELQSQYGHSTNCRSKKVNNHHNLTIHIEQSIHTAVQTSQYILVMCVQAEGDLLNNIHTLHNRSTTWWTGLTSLENQNFNKT